MSMYTQLLGVALDDFGRTAEKPTAGARLAELLRNRNRLDTCASTHSERDWAPPAIADQLAYDIALIELAHCVGIDCDLRGFDQPLPERSRLERALAARGIGLTELQ